MKKTTRLRQLLQSESLEILLEAHNGLSAKIVQEAGFPAVWASGFAISASLGLRDSNEASWTQVVEVVEFMCEATSIPVLMDVDSGYGNFNNVRRLVRKLEQRGVAGMCLEDKTFPKINSLAPAGRQTLARVEEFAGKIKAAKDTQSDADFCLVARVEALIAGQGVDEALARADAYRRAGADAVLIHSKRQDASEILAFMKRWGGDCPVVIVPTTYYRTPLSVFRDSGISTVIWANHMMRAGAAAMQQAAAIIRRDGSPCRLEGEIAPVDEIFRLQNERELRAAEQRYLSSPSPQQPVDTAIAAPPVNGPAEPVVADIPNPPNGR